MGDGVGDDVKEGVGPAESHFTNGGKGASYSMVLFVWQKGSRTGSWQASSREQVSGGGSDRALQTVRHGARQVHRPKQRRIERLTSLTAGYAVREFRYDSQGRYWYVVTALVVIADQ
jgi:hypothetical protein